MGLVVFGVFLFFALPIGAYAYYVAGYIPKRGRAMQAVRWRPLAAKLGGTFSASGGGARFHTLTVPFGTTSVNVVVFDRAAYDRELGLRAGDGGGWRTFVQAHVQGGRGVAVNIFPKVPPSPKGGLRVGDPAFADRHHVEALLGTPTAILASRFMPPIPAAFAALWPKYTSLSVGPSFVSLELPGICADPSLIEAAVYVVGAFAQPVSGYAAAAS
jgi:hypothetical protein